MITIVLFLLGVAIGICGTWMYRAIHENHELNKAAETHEKPIHNKEKFFNMYNLKTGEHNFIKQ